MGVGGWAAVAAGDGGAVGVGTAVGAGVAVGGMRVGGGSAVGGIAVGAAPHALRNAAHASNAIDLREGMVPDGSRCSPVNPNSPWIKS